VISFAIRARAAKVHGDILTVLRKVEEREARDAATDQG
jgi:hypothetical protein